MKYIVAIVFVCLCFTLSVSAQDNFCGIYKTWQDYQGDSFFIQSDCSSHGKVKANLIFSEKNIDVIKNGVKSRFNRDSIFGYRDCDKNDYRFFNGDAYQIKENNALVIYTKNKRVYSSSGKTYTFESSYFFSNGLNGKVLPLTILNLKKAFPDNINFHDLLDTELSDGTAISSFDNNNKMFEVNYLLNKSIPNKNN